MSPRSATAAALLVVTFTLVSMAALVPTTRAAWTGTTHNPANTFVTGDWIADPGTQTFAYTGSAEAFVVPEGYTTVTIEAWGAQGGGSSGGLGGYAKADVPVTPGETLHVYVGQRPTGRSGGWNGGGSGGGGGTVGLGAVGAGGGGASDVRRGGTSLADRVLVGGAGGGVSNNAGGSGGGLTGAAGGGSGGGGGGGQSSGGSAGAGGATAGTLGAGGTGRDGGLLDGLACNGGGGGGAGYYGGGGGDRCSGGGGGSSYVDAAGNTARSTTSGQRSGHGQVTITWGQP